jgi:SAM-dependent methyltransferase
MEKAKHEGVADSITSKCISMLEMDFKDNTFDIIWSEGALYFMGFQKGLRKCHQLLKNNGYLAVTELVYLDSNPPAAVVEYIAGEYPDIKDVNGNIELIRKEGFNLISNFTLPEDSWLVPYYLPMEEELPHLIKKYQGNKIALDVFSAFKKEIDFYKKYSQFYGYEFFIMQKQ